MRAQSHKVWPHLEDDGEDVCGGEGEHVDKHAVAVDVPPSTHQRQDHLQLIGRRQPAITQMTARAPDAIVIASVAVSTFRSA